MPEGFSGDSEKDKFNAAIDDFRDCLTSDGGRAPDDMVCSLEAGRVVNGPGVSSSSSSTSTSPPTSGGDASSTSQTKGSGAGGRMREGAGSAKVAGLVTLLLGVGFLARFV